MVKIMRKRLPDLSFTALRLNNIDKVFTLVQLIPRQCRLQIEII